MESSIPSVRSHLKAHNAWKQVDFKIRIKGGHGVEFSKEFEIDASFYTNWSQNFHYHVIVIRISSPYTSTTLDSDKAARRIKAYPRIYITGDILDYAI